MLQSDPTRTDLAELLLFRSIARDGTAESLDSHRGPLKSHTRMQHREVMAGR